MVNKGLGALAILFIVVFVSAFLAFRHFAGVHVARGVTSAVAECYPDLRFPSAASPATLWRMALVIDPRLKGTNGMSKPTRDVACNKLSRRQVFTEEAIFHSLW